MACLLSKVKVGLGMGVSETYRESNKRLISDHSCNFIVICHWASCGQRFLYTRYGLCNTREKHMFVFCMISWPRCETPSEYRSGLQSSSNTNSSEGSHSKQKKISYLWKIFWNSWHEKRIKLRVWTKRLPLYSKNQTKREKEIFKAEVFQDEINKTSSQISNFLNALSSKKTPNTVSSDTVGQSLFLPHGNTSVEVASGSQDQP